MALLAAGLALSALGWPAWVQARAAVPAVPGSSAATTATRLALRAGQADQGVSPLPVFHYARAAQALPKARPGDRVVLTVEHPGWKGTLTLQQLQSFPVMRYQTYHPQLRQRFLYEGVTLRDLAAYGHMLGRDLRVYASNGFLATIRARDYMNEPLMLAYRADGRPIPVLAKGPLTVVLPQSQQRYATPAYSAAWVWFAVRIAPVP